MQMTSIVPENTNLIILTSLEIAQVSDAISQEFLQQKPSQFSEKLDIAIHMTMSAFIGWDTNANIHNIVCQSADPYTEELSSNDFFTENVCVSLKQPA